MFKITSGTYNGRTFSIVELPDDQFVYLRITNHCYNSMEVSVNRNQLKQLRDYLSGLLGDDTKPTLPITDTIKVLYTGPNLEDVIGVIHPDTPDSEVENLIKDIVLGSLEKKRDDNLRSTDYNFACGDAKFAIVDHAIILPNDKK